MLCKAHFLKECKYNNNCYNVKLSSMQSFNYIWRQKAAIYLSLTLARIGVDIQYFFYKFCSRYSQKKPVLTLNHLVFNKSIYSLICGFLQMSRYRPTRILFFEGRGTENRKKEAKFHDHKWNHFTFFTEPRRVQQQAATSVRPNFMIRCPTGHWSLYWVARCVS